MEHAKLDEFNRSKGKVAEDLKNIVNDTDNLLHATAEVSSQGLKNAREKLTEKLTTVKSSLIDAEKKIVQKSKQSVAVTDKYVKTNPWTALSIAAGVSLLVGFFVAKRR
jgi:ElaB/YqjD/DUF883 family membrane-anchored ribosome-binding protein